VAPSARNAANVGTSIQAAAREAEVVGAGDDDVRQIAGDQQAAHRIGEEARGEEVGQTQVLVGVDLGEQRGEDGGQHQHGAVVGQ
jgi:hypothetical protein